MLTTGFAQLDRVLSAERVASYLAAIERRAPQLVARGPAGLRNVIEVIPETLDLLRLASVAGPVVEVLGGDCRLVRAIRFDKTPATNWNVPWHQDLFVAGARGPKSPASSRGPRRTACLMRGRRSRCFKTC